MLTLEALNEAWDRIRARPPFAVRIYFVDRPALYAQIVAAVPTALEMSRYSQFSGVQIFKVSTADDQTGLPWICRVPGVWAEMSDGKLVTFSTEYVQGVA